MEAVARSAAPARARTLRWLQPDALAAWALGFLPLVYLALREGGWDPIIRNEVGIAIWWIVLLGAAVGVLPLSRIRTAGGGAVGLFAGFALWTALAVGWAGRGEGRLPQGSPR